MHHHQADPVRDHIMHLPLSRAQLRKVIAGPLEHVSDVGYEPGLIDRILKDAADDHGALPLVGFLLAELWKLRAHGLLTLAAYESVGGVSGVVAQPSLSALGETSRSAGLA
ncbi:nSTAND1 domain-containing NTPase [Streptomyces sp. NPDC003236]